MQYKLIIKGAVLNKCINLHECPKQPYKRTRLYYSFWQDARHTNYTRYKRNKGAQGTTPTTNTIPPSRKGQKTIHELQKQDLDIIERVSDNEATPWVSPVVAFVLI